MCGISAIFSNILFPVSEVVKMNNAIKHRGPDDEGFLYSCNGTIFLSGGVDTPLPVYNSLNPDHPKEALNEEMDQLCNYGIGHRRLSIIDTSADGHMPMSFDQQNYWITYNGEVYNYIEIREELEGKGYFFKTQTDTEVILAAYDCWGEDCQDHLTGMWAFIIIDLKRNELFASRDRYGIKPLYYYVFNNRLHFGSEIKQFTVTENWEARLNGNIAVDHLLYSINEHSDETMFKSVYSLPSGSCLKLDLADLKITSEKLKFRKWYNPIVSKFEGTFDEATIIFKDLFYESVSLHLRADVPVGSALSGGLDSSAIVCVVNEILKKKGKDNIQKTFSSCSVYKNFDEREWMELVVDKINVDAHYLYPSVEGIFELTEKLIWHHDEPYSSQSPLLAYHIFKAAKDNNIKVLLNGQGADEFLDGYNQLKFNNILNLVKDFNLIEIKKIIEKSDCDVTIVEILKAISYSIISEKALKTIRSRNSNVLRLKKCINFEKLDYDGLHPYDRIPIKNDKNTLNVFNHNLYYNPLPKYLKWEDRNSMANSVEARVPFLYHKLIEFTLSLPSNFISNFDGNKRIMRSALSGVLPDKIRDRKDKMGFVTPEEKWIKEEKKDMFREKIMELHHVTNGIVNENIITYYDEMIAGKIHFDYTYWRFILFGEWMKTFKVK